MHKYDVITIGSATKDVFLISKNFHQVKSQKFVTGYGECFARGAKVEIEKMHFDTGGGATNSAATFANLGLKTAVVCKVGRDLAGQEVTKAMQQRKIDTRYIKASWEQETGYATIFLANDGERTILVFRGASAFLEPKDIPLKKCASHWIYLTSLNGRLDLLSDIVNTSEQKKMHLAINPGSQEIANQKIYSLLTKAEILIVNQEEAKKLAKVETEEMKFLFLALHKYVNGMIVITNGQGGAWVSDQKNIYHADSLKVKVVNATGAGDAFGSAFVAGMIIYGGIKKALALAMLNASSVIQKMGAKKGLLEKLPSAKRLKSVPIREVI